MLCFFYKNIQKPITILLLKLHLLKNLHSNNKTWIKNYNIYSLKIYRVTLKSRIFKNHNI